MFVDGAGTPWAGKDAEYGPRALAPLEGEVRLVTRYIVHNRTVHSDITGILEVPPWFVDANNNCSNNRDPSNHRNHNYQCAIMGSSRYSSIIKTQCDNSLNARGLNGVAVAAVVIGCHMGVLSIQRLSRAL